MIKNTILKKLLGKKIIILYNPYINTKNFLLLGGIKCQIQEKALSEI